MRLNVESLFSMAALVLCTNGCGGDVTSGDGTNDAAAGGSNLFEEDTIVWCEKGAQCGEETSADECVAKRQGWTSVCTHTPEEIAACLASLRGMDCEELRQISARSCVPLHKSLDGC